MTERFAINCCWLNHAKERSNKKRQWQWCEWVILALFLLQCKCWPGFQLKDDGRTCVDVDECSMGFPCSQQCVNTYGTYRCLCTDGYEVQPHNPNGCKSLSGKESNVSTGPTSVTCMDPEFQSHFIKFISSCCFLEIKILLYLPGYGNLSF